MHGDSQSCTAFTSSMPQSKGFSKTRTPSQMLQISYLTQPSHQVYTLEPPIHGETSKEEGTMYINPDSRTITTAYHPQCNWGECLQLLEEIRPHHNSHHVLIHTCAELCHPLRYSAVLKEVREFALALLRLTSVSADAFLPLKSPACGALHIADLVPVYVPP